MKDSGAFGSYDGCRSVMNCGVRVLRRNAVVLTQSWRPPLQPRCVTLACYEVNEKSIDVLSRLVFGLLRNKTLWLLYAKK